MRYQLGAQNSMYTTAVTIVVKLLLLAALLMAPSAFVALRGAFVPLLCVGLRRVHTIRGEVAAPRRSLGGALRLRRLA